MSEGDLDRLEDDLRDSGQPAGDMDLAGPPAVEGVPPSSGAAPEGGAGDGDPVPEAPPAGDAGNGEEEEDGADDTELPPLPFASVVEAILFAAREPLKPAQIARAAGKGIRQDAVRAVVDELNVHYLENGRAFEIAEISGRFQLMSRPEFVDYIKRVYPKRELEDKDKAARLSPSALDTLAIIAYKQPVTRGEIEHIRGVGCGAVLRALMERGSVKVAGKAQLVGQPWLYGTTEAFLAEFGLGSLDELPLRGEFLSLVGAAPGAAETAGDGTATANAGEESPPPARPDEFEPAIDSGDGAAANPAPSGSGERGTGDRDGRD